MNRFATLQSEATELSGDRDPKYNSILQKISAFQSFSNKRVPYSQVWKSLSQRIGNCVRSMHCILGCN
jgi:hypothetical protein